MLRRISEPLALSEASLLALRPALNAPVLNVDYLPVGPARAAIVIFAEEYGGVGMAFGVRSTEGGQVAVFRNREPIDESAPLDEILEPALAAAERMGFLFDEDMVEGTGEHGRGEATALWGRLMGDVAMPPAPKAAPPLPAATEPILDLTETMVAGEEVPELVLDEVALADPVRSSEPVPVAPPELEVEASNPPPPSPVAAAPVTDVAETEPELDHATPVVASAPDDADPAAPALSKFRNPPPTPDTNSASSDSMTARRDSLGETEGGSALGRVSLVRVRRDGETSKRIPYLARLLSSF